MKAVGVSAYGPVTTLAALDTAEPAGGGVRVQVHASSLNPADIKVITGKDGGRFLHAAQFPLVPGFDFSGVVAGGAGFEPGAEVFGHLPYARSNRQGSLAEYVDVPAASIAPKPSSISHVAAAAAATAGLTALQGLRDAGGLRSGMHVLVNGASGGVGCFAVQIAKQLGATVTGVCSSAKAELVQGLGAERVVDYRAQPVLDLDARFDIVFDCAAALSFWAARRLIQPRGSYVTTLPSVSAVTGAAFGWATGRRCKLIIVKSKASDLAQLGSWLAKGELRVPLDRTVPSSAAGVLEGLQRLASGEVRGKIGVDGPGR